MMPLNVKFAVVGEPKPQPRPRAFARNMGGGRFAARVYDAGTAEGWKSLVAMEARRHLPESPATDALRVSLRFLLPRPKGHYTGKGVLRASSPAYPTNKMDCDNLAKAVLDALTQIGMWQDDGQVVRLEVAKEYATTTPGAVIEIVTNT